MDRLWRTELHLQRADDTDLTDEQVDRALDRLPDGSSITVTDDGASVEFVILLTADSALDALGRASNRAREAWRWGAQRSPKELLFGQMRAVHYDRWLADHDPTGAVRAWAANPLEARGGS